MKEAEAKRTEYQENLRRGTLAANDKATFGDAAAVWLIYKRGQLGEKGALHNEKSNFHRVGTVLWRGACR